MLSRETPSRGCVSDPSRAHQPRRELTHEASPCGDPEGLGTPSGRVVAGHAVRMWLSAQSRGLARGGARSGRVVTRHAVLARLGAHSKDGAQRQATEWARCRETRRADVALRPLDGTVAAEASAVELRRGQRARTDDEAGSSATRQPPRLVRRWRARRRRDHHHAGPRELAVLARQATRRPRRVGGVPGGGRGAGGAGPRRRHRARRGHGGATRADRRSLPAVETVARPDARRHRNPRLPRPRRARAHVRRHGATGERPRRSRMGRRAVSRPTDRRPGTCD